MKFEIEKIDGSLLCGNISDLNETIRSLVKKDGCILSARIIPENDYDKIDIEKYFLFCGGFNDKKKRD